jgi:lysozyme family protein
LEQPSRRSGWGDHAGRDQQTYNLYRDQHGLPRQSVRGLSDAELRAIYGTMYWLPAGCAGLPLPLAVAVFDTAVNCGVGGAHRLLARTVPGLAPLARAEALVDQREAFRADLIRRKPSLGVFRTGWHNRDEALRQYVRSL